MEICYGLDELANAYCPDFWDDVDPLERLNNTASDGHIYTLRGGYNNTAVYDDEKIPISPPWTMNIRTDFLQKLNSPMPASVEELETLLYKAKDSGFTMPYRMCGATETPLASWMGVKRDLSWDAEAKKVHTPLRDEAWLPYLKMMAKWYRDGVLILPKQEDLLQGDLTRDLAWLDETAENAFVSAIPQEGAYLGPSYLGDSYSEHAGDKDVLSFPFALWMEPMTYQGQIQLQAADQAISSWDSTPGKGWRRHAGTFISRGCSQPPAGDTVSAVFKRATRGQSSPSGASRGSNIRWMKIPCPSIKRVFSQKRASLPIRGSVPVPLYMASITGPLWITAGFPARWRAPRWPMSPTKIYWRCARCRFRRVSTIRNTSPRTRTPFSASPGPKRVPPTIPSSRPSRKNGGRGILAIITQSVDDAAAEDAWKSLCTEMATLGLDTLEDSMTVRFADALKRYQAEGYFTDIQP